MNGSVVGAEGPSVDAAEHGVLAFASVDGGADPLAGGAPGFGLVHEGRLPYTVKTLAGAVYGKVKCATVYGRTMEQNTKPQPPTDELALLGQPRTPIHGSRSGAVLKAITPLNNKLGGILQDLTDNGLDSDDLRDAKEHLWAAQDAIRRHLGVA